MARTIVNLDEKLLKKAMRLSGVKVKVTLVNLTGSRSSSRSEK